MQAIRLVMMMCLTLVLGLGQLSAIHTILYFDDYLEEALRLEEVCEEKFGIATTLRPVRSQFKKSDEGGIALAPVPTPSEDPRWTEYWNMLRGEENTRLVEPRVIMEVLGSPELLTILGNPMEVPPSTVTGSGIEGLSDKVFHDGFTITDQDEAFGYGSDYYYVVNSGSHLPEGAVSRIPITVTDFSSQVDFISIDRSIPSNTIVKAQSFGDPLEVNELQGKSIYLELALGGGEEAAWPFYQAIQAHTATLPDGFVKLLVTDLEDGGYALNNPTDYPYFINKAGVDGIDPSIKGAFAYFSGDDLIEVFDPWEFGRNSLLVTNENAIPIDGDSDLVDPKVTAYVFGRLYFAGLIPFGQTVDEFGQKVNDGDVSAVIIMRSGGVEGAIYPISSYDPGSATVPPSFIIAAGVGDELPVDPDDILDAEFDVFDMTSIRDYLNSLGGGYAVSYVKPSFFKNEETNTSRLGSFGYLFDLKASAQQVVTKIEAYNNYIWGELSGKVPYLHSAMVIGSNIRGRWDYNAEHVVSSLVGSQDQTNFSNPSIFNGYNLTKIYHSNDASEPEDGVAESDNLLRPIGDLSGVFAGVTKGTVIQLSNQVLSGETDSEGIFEFQIKAGDVASKFRLEGEGQFTDRERALLQAELDELRADSSVNSALIGDAENYNLWARSVNFLVDEVGEPRDLVFSMIPEIRIGENNNQGDIRITLVDANGMKVNSSLGVTLTVFDPGTIPIAESDTYSFNLINGEATVTIEAANTGLLFGISMIVSADDGSVNGDFGWVEVVDSPTTERAVWINYEAQMDHFEGLEDTITLRAQAYDTYGQKVDTQRFVRFKLEKGPSKKVIDGLNGKGVLFLTDDWTRGIWDSYYLRRGSEFDFPKLKGEDPELSLMITAGESGYNTFYELNSVFGYGEVAEELFIDNRTSSGNNYTGIFGYLGTQGFAFSNEGGRWDKGFFSPVDRTTDLLKNRHILAREAMKEYTNADQPTLGSLWRESITNFLREKRISNQWDNDESFDTMAESYKDVLANWNAIGMAAQAIPPHQQFPKVGNPPEADEVPKPALELITDGLRPGSPYDRFEVPVLEVPHEDGNTGEVVVTISVNNLLDRLNEDDDVVSRGMLNYDEDIKFRYTLVSVPLDQPYDDPDQYQQRISEIDFDIGGKPPVSDIFMVTEGEPGEGEISYTFSEHWQAEDGNILKRGPGLYMVKVEAQEKARIGDLYDIQKIPNYTKETRLFFKVVNEFIPDDSSQFLLVNNTDHDPYKLSSGFDWGGASDYYAPSTSIRFYEDALDNYQYTRGTFTVSNLDSGMAMLSADNVSDMHLQYRISVGDKIRVQEQEDAVFGEWHRITDMAEDGSWIEVEDRDDFFEEGVFNEANYYIQRAYTTGYATVSYTWEAITIPPELSRTITITVPVIQDKGMLNVVQAGDFMKILEGRTYTKIQSFRMLNAGIDVDGVESNVYEVVLEDDYPFENLYHYHSLDDLWGGPGRLVPGSALEQSFNTNFAIYPPKPNNEDKPNRLYNTWNVHNYVTTNDEGLGVHGDVTSGILDRYAVGDNVTGVRHKAVVWANDMGYGPWVGWAISPQDRDGDGYTETEMLPGGSGLYLSDRDLALLTGFLGQGGRLLTGGQDVFIDPEDEFFTNVLGLSGGGGTQPSIIKVANDPISNIFDNEVSLTTGFGTGQRDVIEEQTQRTSTFNESFTLINGKSLPVFTYSGPTSVDSVAVARASGGPDTRPWAVVYHGFDFPNMSFSGIHSEFADLSDSGWAKGRNLYMKNSLDWLRDPSRTSLDQSVRVVYSAENRDFTRTNIVLDIAGGDRIDDALHAANQSFDLLTGVGPNQDVVLSVTGGTIYNETTYNWRIVGQSADGESVGELFSDPSEPDNEDNHKVIFRTGSAAEAVYTLQLQAPDDGLYLIPIKTTKQPLFMQVMNTSELTEEEQVGRRLVVDNQIIYQPGGNIEFRSLGGDGTYAYSMITGDESFTNNEDGSLFQDQGRSRFYYMPDGVTVSEPVSVPMLVESGSAIATDTLTVLPPLSFVNASEGLVVGDKKQFRVVGGTGSSQGYDFSANLVDGSQTIPVTTELELEPSEDAISVSVGIDPVFGSTLSTDPNAPSVAVLNVTDRTFTSSGTSAEINLFAPPTPQYGEIQILENGTEQASDETFLGLSASETIRFPDSGVLPLQLVGGTGSMEVSISNKSDDLFPATIAEIVDGYSSVKDDNGEIISSSANTREALVYQQVGQVAYSGDVDVLLYLGPKRTPASLTLTLKSGTVERDFTINLRTSINLETQKGTEDNAVVYAGQSILLKPQNVDTNRRENVFYIKGLDANATTNLSYTFTPNSIGSGFLDPTELSNWLSDNTFSGNFTTTTVAPANDTVIFVAGVLEEKGTITVEDLDSEVKTPIRVEVTSADPMTWAEDDLSGPISMKRQQRKRFDFEGGKPPFSVSHTFELGTETGLTTLADTRTVQTSILIGSSDDQGFNVRSFLAEGTGTVIVRDSEGVELRSGVITIGTSGSGGSQSSGSISVGVGSGGGGGGVSAGGGGGGCLLRD